MSFFPYLGVVAAILLAVFISYFSTGTPSHKAAIVASESSSSTPQLVVVPDTKIAPITIQELLPTLPPAAQPTPAIAPSAATTTKVKVVPTQVAPTKKPTSSPAPVAPVVTPPPAKVPAPLASSGNISLDVAASHLRDALVNIVCNAPVGSRIHSISGSGVIVDSRGIILTNAHVAQMFLLADKNVWCEIRTGSPAVDAYRAAPIFISPAWLHANSSVLAQAAPEGSGEYDYALLAITNAAPGKVLPATFPAVPLAQSAPDGPTPVVIASYGAQFLQPTEVQSALFPTIVFGSVKAIYTFAENSIDILALGGSAAAQEGSSGGGVADTSGNLVGTITISTIEGDTSARSLYAITASYIRRIYIQETGTTIDTLLASTPAEAIKSFALQIPGLEAIITPALTN